MPSRESTILVVDRPDAAEALASVLRERGWKTVTADDEEAARRALDDGRVHALVTPLHAPHTDGLAVCAYARRRHAGICVILAVDPAQTTQAGAAFAAGAAAVVPQPIDPEWLAAAVERGIAQQRLAEHAAVLERELDERVRVAPFDGRSRAIERVMEQVRHLASTHAPVLIEGEAGTGRSLAARAVHQNSPRRDGPFVACDCGSLPAPRLERELFGEEAGGAASREVRPGRVEQADGGTLFLADVDALPAGAQVRVLRLLQDHAYERLGGGATLRVDVRLLVATGRDLAEQVAAGAFREDLLQRIDAVRIRMPPLRERREDIPFLVERFVTEASRTHDRRLRGVTPGVLDRLTRHDWPGNVRELRDVVERMVTVARRGTRLEPADLWPALSPESEPAGLEIEVGTTVGDAERRLIIATLAHAGYDKPRAAALLGIGLRTLYRKIKEYGIRPPAPGS